MVPTLFGGYVATDDGSKVATAEKALFDLVYLGPTRTRLFASIPELDIQQSFRWSEVAKWTKRISGKSRRVFVKRKMAEIKAES
jgi:hypothetical protein